jgi:hypothetical protein
VPYLFLDPELLLTHIPLLKRNQYDFSWRIPQPSSDEDFKCDSQKLTDLSGKYQVKNGLILLNLLNDLVENHNYQIVLFTQLSLDEQDKIYQGLTNSMIKQGLTPLKIAFLNYKTSNQKTLFPMLNSLHHVPIINWGWDDSEDNKIGLRTNLEHFFSMNKDDIAQSFILDAQPEVCEIAKAAGYQVASSVQELCGLLKSDMADLALTQLQELEQSDEPAIPLPVDDHDFSFFSPYPEDFEKKQNKASVVARIIHQIHGYGLDNPKVITALNTLKSEYECDKLNDQQHNEYLKLILKNFISELENNFWHPYELSCYIFNCILGLVTFVVLSPILLFEKDLRDEHFHSFFSLPYQNIVNYMNKECSKIGVSLG